MTTIPKPVRKQSRHTSVNAQFETAQPKADQPKDVTMNFAQQVQLINEALSRARMRRPQTANSEATRPARQIMMSARSRERERLLGL